MSNTVIIHGHQGCGETTNKDALAKHFGCSQVVDDWTPWRNITVGALHLTCSPITGKAFREADRLRAQVIDFELAMQQIEAAKAAV